jgi:hypothetical protein
VKYLKITGGGGMIPGIAKVVNGYVRSGKSRPEFGIRIVSKLTPIDLMRNANTIRATITKTLPCFGTSHTNHGINRWGIWAP